MPPIELVDRQPDLVRTAVEYVLILPPARRCLGANEHDPGDIKAMAIEATVADLDRIANVSPVDDRSLAEPEQLLPGPTFTQSEALGGADAVDGHYSFSAKLAGAQRALRDPDSPEDAD